MNMAKIFIGVDRRQPVAYNVLQWSLQWNSKRPLQIAPLLSTQLPEMRRGLTDFTYSRYLVPYLCNFEGRALFIDGDMVVTEGTDINELFDMMPADFDIAVNRSLPRFEWPSMMLFNCERFEHLTPEYVNDASHAPIVYEDLNVFDIPEEWNRMVVTGGHYRDSEGAKILHFTQGLPCFFETQRTPGASVWQLYKRHMLHSVPWKDLMLKSVHGRPVLEALINYYQRDMQR